MDTWAVIPVKPLDHAKSRLAGILTLEQRASLVIRLFEHTLDVLCDWNILSLIMVVSASQKIWQISERYGVNVLKEPEAINLNLSLEFARQEIIRRGADAMLIVAADIPGLNRSSLRKIFEYTQKNNPFVVIAPDRPKKGTNVMYLSPPGIINFSYGPDSFLKHRGKASLVNADFYCVLDPLLNFDVDTPSDFKMRRSVRTLNDAMPHVDVD